MVLNKAMDRVAATRDKELRALEKKQSSKQKDEDRMLALKPTHSAGDLVRKVAADELRKAAVTNDGAEPAGDAEAVDVDLDVSDEPVVQPEDPEEALNTLLAKPSRSQRRAARKKKLDGDKASGQKTSGQRSSSAPQQKSHQRRGRSRSRVR